MLGLLHVLKYFTDPRFINKTFAFVFVDSVLPTYRTVPYVTYISDA